MQALRRPASRAFVLAALVAALSTTIFGGNALAANVSITSASFSGGANTAVVGGVLYAKGGATVTLTVNTSSNASCVVVTGAHSGQQIKGNGQTTWSFPFTAGSGNGPMSVHVVVYDRQQCDGQNTASTDAAYTLDNTAPSVTGAVSPAANAVGWNKTSPVSVAWSATDTGSGVTSGPNPAGASQTADTAGQTLTSSATDRVGNTGSGSVVVKLDRGAPSITHTVTPAPNANGWNNQASVSVAFNCTDALSGVKSCTGGGTATTEGISLPFSGTATDNADNIASDSIIVRIDRTVPMLSGVATTSPNPNGWYKSDVAIAWSGNDNIGGSGIDPSTLPANSVITGEGAALTASAGGLKDQAGNTAATATSPAVKIDRTAPLTTANAPMTFWNNQAVTIALTANDVLSGVASTHYTLDGGADTTGTTVVISADGQHTLTFWSVDRAGNVEAQKTVQVNIDRTPPTITHTQSPLANGNGWNNTSVTITFTCADAASGIKSCTTPQTVATEGLNQAVPGTAVDNADNSTADPAKVSIDKTSPLVSAAPATPANPFGWYSAPVTITFTCADALSGIATCAAPQTLGEGAAQSASGSGSDAADNSASGGLTGINVDTTPPTLSGAATTGPNANGWYNRDVTVHWTAADLLSGVDPATIPADSVAGGEGAQVGASATVADRAGNSKSATVDGLKIDRTAPFTTADASPPLANGWWGHSATVTLAASDGLSGVESTYYDVDGGSTQAYAGPFNVTQGGVHTIHFWSSDRAGNVEDDADAAHKLVLKIDRADPSIVATRVPAANGFGWNNGTVSVAFDCADGETGVATCPAAVDLAGEGADQSVTRSVSDRAGNSASALVDHVDIDLTSPTLTGAVATDPNANGWYNHDVTVHWTAGDALSGVDPATVPADSVVTGEGANLATAAVHVFDKAGNQGQGSKTGIQIDRTAPNTTAAVPDTFESTGWHAGPIQVSLAGHDTLSGVDTTYYSVDGGEIETYDGSFQFGEPGVHTITFWSVDLAGNLEDKTATGNSITVKLDNLAPTVHGSRAPAGNGFGWNNGPVAVTFACSDGETGIKTPGGCVGNKTLTGEGAGQSVTGHATDNAGNEASDTVDDVNIDLTKPTLSGAATNSPNANGWYKGDVTIHWTADDALSGIDPATAPADDLLTGEGNDLGASATVSDKAGNARSASVSGVKIDRHAPNTTRTLPAPFRNGWYRGPFQVELTATDLRSGVDATYYSVDDGPPLAYDGPFTFGAGGIHTISFWSVDRAGNVENKDAAANSIEVKVDDRDPSIDSTRTPSANAFGWNKGPVSVAFACDDAETGIKAVGGCIGDTTLSAEGEGQSVTGTATDNAGNKKSTTVDNIDIDLTDPFLSGAANEAPNAAGWYKGDVVVHWSAGDALSGIDPATVPADTVITGEGASLVAGPVSVSDKAGNSASASVGGIKIDRTAPTITGAPTTSPNANGWYRHAVTVAFAATDELSGVAAPPADKVLEDDGANQSVTSDPVLDVAGNKADGLTVGGISIDSHAPISTSTLHCTSQNDWCKGDTATVELSATDQFALSGVDSIHYSVDGGEYVTVDGSSGSADVPLSGTGKATVAYYAVDKAGNVEGENSVSIKWDNLAPVVTHSVNAAANADGWNQADTTVHFSATDELGGSGISFVTPDVLVGDETDGRLVEGHADDVAGNRGTDSVTVKLDKTPPTITAVRTAPNAHGWSNEPVTVHFTCADALSHVKRCADDVTLTEQGANQSASGTAMDTAGNTASTTVANIDIDRTKPELTGTATTEPNAAGWYDGDVTIHWTATDDLSGVDASTLPANRTITGQGDDLGASANVSDRAGNVGSGSVRDVKIDRVAPATTLGRPAPLASGWYTHTFPITLSATDNLSGVDATYYSVDNGPAHAVSGAFEYDVRGVHTLRYWSVDRAGNAENKTSVEFELDDVAPTISASRTPAANAYGWNNGIVTAHFACADAQTGIAQCEADHDFTHEGAGQSRTGTAVDDAGNTATATVDDVNIDLTDPTLSGAATTAPNPNGWYKGDVTINWTAADVLSGIEHAPANDVLTGEGDSLGASASVSDKAGNSTSASVTGIRIDRHDPSTTLHVPTAPASGWYRDMIPVTLDPTDDLSGVDKTYYAVDGDPTPSLYSGTFAFGEGGIHTLTYWSVDNAGNVEAKSTETIKIDALPPTITGSRVPSANAWGWNKGSVTVHFDCADTDSGNAGCDPDTTVANEGANQSVTGTASDLAGNAASTVVDGINIDKTDPTLAGVPTQPANAAGWWNHDVTIHWNAADGLSGIDPGTVPANTVVGGEGASLGAGPVGASDKAGNSASASVSGIKIDRTAPTITASRPSPNAAGWYNAAVTVTYACADSLSGVATCPDKHDLTGDGAGQSVASDQALDIAGNAAPGVTTAGINIDSKAPQSTATESCGAGNGYCQSSATVIVDATDQAGLSGVKELHYAIDNGAEHVVAGSSATITVALSGNGAASVSYWAVDNAGNVERKNGVSLKYDTIAPTLTHTLTPAANAGGWDKSNTLVHFDALDDVGGSGVNAATVTPDSTVSSETAGLTVNGQALDMAGNKGTDSVSVKLDKTAPSIVGAPTTSPNANGWFSAPVTVHFTCSDTLSGIATCPVDTTLTANGAGQQVSGTAADKADNSRDTLVSGINIDATKPTLSFTGVADGGIYTLGAVPAPGCTATDAGSGLSAPCKVTVAGGTTNGVGTFTATSTATDKAGNATTSSISYTVIYRWDGFLQPINDTAHQVGTSTSTFKGNSTVPAKFQLKKADGTVVQANTLPKWLVPAKGSSTSAAVDESVYSDPATNGTTYAWDGAQYQYNWSTKGLATGFYWRIGVVLDDGRTYEVNIGVR